MVNAAPIHAATAVASANKELQEVQAAQAATITTDPLGGSSRLSRLLDELEERLKQRYEFDVFAKDSINFGIMVTYRQTWKPHQYQVGDLVSTIPLAPKEVRRYTTRSVTKKSRAVKEIEDNVQTRRTETGDTSRADEEIVKKAREGTHFNVGAEETFGGDGFSVKATQSGGGNSDKESARIKKEMREGVLKSAQEYRQQHRMEVDSTESWEDESTTFHEIQNPNDELAVTYLFYELQRTYRISEEIRELVPVVLVANDVPAPHEIDDAWLIEHDWILRRVLLDDSFRPAIDYLTKSFVGAELRLRTLEANAVAQKGLVDRIGQQLGAQMNVLATNEGDVRQAMEGLADNERQQGIFNTVKRIFDPLGITGGADSGVVDAAQTMVDYAKQTVDRAERERARLLSQLDIATTALQSAVDKLAAAITEHYDRVAEIDRLRIHVKDNILYYMQAIWRQEPPDQRFFRLYDIDVPIVTPNSQSVPVTAGAVHVGPPGSVSGDTVSVSLPMPQVTVTKKKLVEVADLENVLAYKGNYMVFALKENDFITLHMMQDYLDVDEELGLRDPDPFGNFSVEELRRYAECMIRTDPDRFAQQRDQFKQALIDRLSAPRRDNDLVVVPSDSLYIECLVGTHPLLEDFKLAHRALDVKKVQADVRHSELENIRLAARALKGKDDDPDIEKKIVVEGPVSSVIPND